jgi:hypothetical protein
MGQKHRLGLLIASTTHVSVLRLLCSNKTFHLQDLSFSLCCGFGLWSSEMLYDSLLMYLWNINIQPEDYREH